MTDEEVLDQAAADGFELIGRMSAGRWVYRLDRGEDDRWPCFLEERSAQFNARSAQPDLPVRVSAPERALLARRCGDTCRSGRSADESNVDVRRWRRSDRGCT